MQMCPYITPAHLLPNGRRNMIKPSSTGIHYVKYVLHISQTQETSETLSQPGGQEETDHLSCPLGHAHQNINIHHTYRCTYHYHHHNKNNNCKLNLRSFIKTLLK